MRVTNRRGGTFVLPNGTTLLAGESVELSAKAWAALKKSAVVGALVKAGELEAQQSKAKSKAKAKAEEPSAEPADAEPEAEPEDNAEPDAEEAPAEDGDA